MRLRQVDASQYIERIRARDYDMIVSSFSQSNSPGNERYSFWHSSSYADPGGYNHIGLKDPAIDRLVQAVVEADSRAAPGNRRAPPRPGAAMGLLPDPDLVFRRGLDRQLESLRPTAAGARPAWLNTWWEVRERAARRAGRRSDMGGYLLRRLALILPTLLGILLINFAIVQAAPGGPVDQAIARLQGVDGGGPLGRGGGGHGALEPQRHGETGIDPQLVAALERQYGFDKPPLQRLWLMLSSYARLDFGEASTATRGSST